ncbi:ATP-binding protein [Desulfatirhabdium butyrativorans]|uniref:ATP-binding protein n=1 Tax=Desulfatirhabdium butyrativorans TaxID=340467 RepID=UPI0003FD475C|nr:ATP-binding protein [Desulfatirhabdium butyrativorans]
MDNPFRHRIVSDPFSGPKSTIAEIHQDAFVRCLRLIDVVRREHRTASMLVTGRSGSGKTHLLHRIHEALLQDKMPHAFIAVRLHTSAKRFWRHLRTSCIESLQRPARKSRPQIETLILRRIWEKANTDAVRLSRFQQILDELRLEANISPSLALAMTHLIRRHRKTDVLAWLKGYSLPEENLGLLSLPNPPEDETCAEDQARDFLEELFRMIGPQVPVVLCFDQVEALQRDAHDKAGLFAFGQAVRSLYNDTRNLVLISCIQTTFYGTLKEAVSDPDFHGMTEYQIALKSISLEQACRLIEARMAGVGNQAHKQRLMPTILAGLREKWADSEQTARDALNIAAALYDELTEQPTQHSHSEHPDAQSLTTHFLQNEFENRVENGLKTLSADDLDAVLHSAIPVLCPLYHAGCTEVDTKPQPDIDVFLRHQGRTIPVSFCNQANLTSLAGRLRRLLSLLESGGIPAPVMIRHPGRPLPGGQRKANEYLNGLKRKGAKWVVPSEEAIATLAAMRDLLADAQSGDLAASGKSIAPETVRQWIQQSGDDSACSLLNEIVQPPRMPPVLSPEIETRLQEILQEERILYLSEMAEKLRIDENTLSEGLRLQPGGVGFMEGPPVLLFDRSVLIHAR